MSDAVRNLGPGVEVARRSWLAQILLELRNLRPASDNEAALERKLHVGAPIKHPARARIEARRTRPPSR